jgi:uncharacterized protein involved in outer membrane biogenesis
MPTTTTTPPANRKPRRWPRRVAFGLGGFLLLLVLLFFVVSSATFFKAVILPRVSDQMNAEVTVSDASISPFSRVVLRDLKVQTTGTEPLVTAKEARVVYRLWDIVGGNLTISQCVLSSPTVTIVNNADGTSNLDPITKSQRPDSPKEPKKPQPESKPLQVDLARFALNNATIRSITHHSAGGRDVTELSGVNVTLDNLKNGQTAKLGLAADISIDNQPPPPADRASLQAKVEGNFDLGLAADLTPSGGKGGLRLTVQKSEGTLAPLNGLLMVFNTDFAADAAKESAVLRAFTLTGSQNQKEFLLANLSGPMTLAWGQNSAPVGDAALNVTLTNVNLADWKAFAADLDPGGVLNATLALTSKQGGQQIDFNLASEIANLRAKLDTNPIEGANVKLTAMGQASNLKRFNIPSFQLGLARNNEPVVTLSGSAVADTEKQTTEAQLNMEAFLQQLLQMVPQPDVKLTSGRVQLTAKVAQAASSQNVAGTLVLGGLTGSYGERRFTNLMANAAYDVGVSDPQKIDLRRCQLTLAATPRVQTNAVELTGTLDLSKTNALEGALKLVGETLDVTPYYDLFADQPTPTGKPDAPLPQPSEKPGPGGGDTEPEAVQLPIKLLTFDARIGRGYLREVELSNLVTLVRIEGSHVTLKPMQASINGGPVDADVDLNLGVPGYQYAVRFHADRVPLEPLANSFSPEYRGRAKGELVAAVDVKGAGVTGSSLRKTLAGNFNFHFTNANIQIASPRVKGFLAPIAAAVNAPGLLESPIHQAVFASTLGQGKIKLDEMAVLSSAFVAATAGEIPIADDLMASKLNKWPMTFQLERSLAEKLRLAPADLPTNAVYAPLPDFVRVTGTLDAPKPDLDLKALASAALLKYADQIPGVDEKTSGLIKGIGGILSGAKKGDTNSPPATNKSPASGLLDLLKKPKK